MNINADVLNVKPIEVQISDINVIIAEETYTGEYVVTPSTETQTLYTTNKTLVNDVTVKSIPYSSVTNPSGGYTATIG